MPRAISNITTPSPATTSPTRSARTTGSTTWCGSTMGITRSIIGTRRSTGPRCASSAGKLSRSSTPTTPASCAARTSPRWSNTGGREQSNRPLQTTLRLPDARREPPLAMEHRMAVAASVPSTRLPVLCLAAGLWAFSFGACAELASVWLKRAGYDYTVVGLNTSVYYLGIALAAGLVPWMIRHWGRWGLAAGMIASGLSAMLFPWGGGLAGWFVLRALNGVGGAMSLIPLETLVNHTSPPERRSRNFGFYAVAVAVGMALGTWLGMELDASSPRLAFLVGGGVTLVGTVVLVWLPEYRGLAEPRHGRTPLGFVRNFFSFGSAWSQGFLEGGMVSQLPIYLLALGFAENAVGQLLGGLMVGVIAAQLPVAWLADQLGRTQVLFGCYGMVAAGLIWLWCAGGSAGMPIALFLV